MQNHIQSRQHEVVAYLTIAFSIALLIGPGNSVEAQPFAYVPNLNDGTVSVIDTAATPNVVVDTVAVGAGPVGAAITPDGTRAYVANNDSNTVSVIDTTVTPRIVVDTVAVGPGPVDVAITPDGTRAYVTNFDGTTVSVIDTTVTPNVVVDTVTVGARPVGVAFTPNGTRAYVASQDSFFVSVIDTTVTPNVVVDSPFVGGPGSGRPRRIAITPDGTRAYVAKGQIVGGQVAVIDTTVTPNLVVDTIVVGVALGLGSSPDGVAISPDGTRAYIANLGGGVSVIDTTVTPNVVLETVAVGPANDVAITPDGTRAYVTHRNENTVSVLDTSVTPHVVLETVAVGSGPLGVAITPRGLRAHWAFDDGLDPTKDSVNGNDGDLVGDVAFLGGFNIPPLVANVDALDLNPNANGNPSNLTGYVEINDHTTLDLTESITVSAWVNLRSLLVSNPFVITKEEAALPATFNYAIQAAAKPRFFVTFADFPTASSSFPKLDASRLYGRRTRR